LFFWRFCLARQLAGLGIDRNMSSCMHVTCFMLLCAV
jgi:hypothetical protein